MRLYFSFKRLSCGLLVFVCPILWALTPYKAPVSKVPGQVNLEAIVKHTSPSQPTVLRSSSGGGINIASGSGTVNWMQVFFYGQANPDGTCANILATASIIDNNSGISVASGDFLNLNPKNLYTLASNQGIDPETIGCMNLYMNGSHFSFSGMSCQAFTDLTCSNVGSTCTSSQIKSIDWVSNPTVCTKQNAYISNDGNNLISQCTVENDGKLSNCANIMNAPFSKPVGGVEHNGYIYIANSNNTVSKCVPSSDNASVNSVNCAYTATDAVFDAPNFIAIKEPFAYITNENANNVSKCRVSPTDGGLSDCTVLASDTFNEPTGITVVDTLTAGTIAYVVNHGAESVSSCKLNDDTGNFVSCEIISSGGSLYKEPKGIFISSPLTDGYVYVANEGENNPNQGDAQYFLTICEFTSSGSFQQCKQNVSSKFDKPQDVLVYDGFVYITNQGSLSEVTQCTAGAGNFSECNNRGDISLNKPLGIFVNTTDDMVYIINNQGDQPVKNCSGENLDNCVAGGSNQTAPKGIALNNGYGFVVFQGDDGKVFHCNVDPSSGIFLNCTGTGSGFDTPKAITIDRSYAYVVNNQSAVSKCTISAADGSFSNCAHTGSDFDSATDISINNGYAYIVDSNSDQVTICTVTVSNDDNDGDFTNCAKLAGPGGLSGIAISNNTMYLTSNNNNVVSQCTINSDGSYANCVTTGSGFSAPQGMTGNTTGFLGKAYAYVVNNNSNNVSQCLISSSDASLSDCTATASDLLSAPKFIAIY